MRLVKQLTLHANSLSQVRAFAEILAHNKKYSNIKQIASAPKAIIHNWVGPHVIFALAEYSCEKSEPATAHLSATLRSMLCAGFTFDLFNRTNIEADMYRKFVFSQFLD